MVAAVLVAIVVVDVIEYNMVRIYVAEHIVPNGMGILVDEDLTLPEWSLTLVDVDLPNAPVTPYSVWVSTAKIDNFLNGHEPYCSSSINSLEIIVIVGIHRLLGCCYDPLLLVCPVCTG